MASLQDAVCVSFDGPVVSLRSTTGYRLGSRWDQDAEALCRSLPNQRVTDISHPARLNLAVYGLSGEWSRATWTLPQEWPEGECCGAHQFYTPPPMPLASQSPCCGIMAGR